MVRVQDDCAAVAVRPTAREAFEAAFPALPCQQGPQVLMA
jgi:hypothetical protein